MKKSRFTESQIVFALKQYETGVKVEEENSQLKKLVADLSLDKQILQDVMKKKF